MRPTKKVDQLAMQIERVDYRNVVPLDGHDLLGQFAVQGPELANAVLKCGEHVRTRPPGLLFFEEITHGLIQQGQELTSLALRQYLEGRKLFRVGLRRKLDLFRLVGAHFQLHHDSS